MNRRKYLCLAAVILVAAAVFLSCSDDDKVTSGGPVLNIDSTSPINGAMRVPLDQIIKVEFSDTLDCVLSDSTWLTVSGGIEGDLTCQNKTLTFTTLSEWEINTEYTVTLSAGITDISGIALGGEHKISFKSFDGTGEIWHEVPDRTFGEIADMAWGNGRFVAVGRGTEWGDGAIYWSSGAVNWTTVSEDWPVDIFGITFFNDKFYAVGAFGTVAASSDGIVWEDRNKDSTTWYKDIACSDGMIVALAGDHVIKSTNGNTWNRYDLPFDSLLDRIFWTGSEFIITSGVGFNDMPAIMTSTDGQQWEFSTIPGLDLDSYSLLAVAASDALIVAAGRMNTVISSVDGIHWVKQDFGLPWGEDVFIRDMLWDGYQFIAVGGSHLAAGGFVATSPDGVNWNYLPYFSAATEFETIAWSGEKLAAFLIQITAGPDSESWAYYSP